MPTLVGLSPEAPVTVTVTTSPWRIGRAPECELVLDHPSISKVHVELTQAPHGWVLRNRSRTNPARLGDAVVIGDRPIADGCLIGLGPVVFRFVAADPTAADATDDLPRTVGYSDSTVDQASQRPDHAGRINGPDGVLNLIAMFQTSRVSGRLSLREPSGGELSLYYESGEVIGAKSVTLVGRHAVILLALRTYGDYRFYEGEKWDGERMRGGTSGMLLEVSRMIDSRRRSL